MFTIIDERPGVRDAFISAFAREGVTACGLHPAEFDGWHESLTRADLAAIEGILVGDCPERVRLARALRGRGAIPAVAAVDLGSLENTLELFAAGFDDVVRKPVHVRELMARCRAIGCRRDTKPAGADCGAIRVFFDGRDPVVGGDVMVLPRRERRILEHLVANRGRRVTKAQIYNAIYGLFDDNVEENVVESHVSKLRKKLRARLGFDPIESKRFLGYCFSVEQADARPARSVETASCDALIAA